MSAAAVQPLTGEGRRIWLVVLLPILGLLLFFAYVASEKYAQYRTNVQTLRMVHVARAAAAVAHQVQRERGLAVVFAASPAVARLPLGAQIVQTDEAIARFLTLVAGQESSNTDGLLGREVADVVRVLGHFRENRAFADLDHAFLNYTRIISQIILIGGSIPRSPELADLLSAYLSIGQWKEWEGRERAIAGGGFALGRFDFNRLQDLLQAQAKEEINSENVFRRLTTTQDSFARAALEGRFNDVIDRFREQAKASFTNGHGVNADAMAWYDAKSERIDRLHNIEEKIAEDLVAAATELRSRARDAFQGVTVAVLLLLGVSLESLRRSEMRARKATQRLSDAVENIGEGFALWDDVQGLLLCNARYRELAVMAGDSLVLGSGQVGDREERLGEDRWLLTSERRLPSGERVSLYTDITELRRREEALRLSATMLEIIDEGVTITDAAGNIEFVNPAFCRITGYQASEVVGKNPRLLASGRHPPEFYQEMWATLEAQGSWRGEIWNRRKTGEFYAEYLSISTLRSEDGAIRNRVAVFADITTRKEDEERIWLRANYDLLTCLCNRPLFHDHLVQATRQARREKTSFALLFIDLDGFKAINDIWGHAAGDLVLQETGHRLRRSVRESDTAARLAGDEFCLLTLNLGQPEDALEIAKKVLTAIVEPITLPDGEPVGVGASIGIAIYPDDAEDAEGLMAKADAAMYEVKRAGKNGVRWR